MSWDLPVAVTVHPHYPAGAAPLTGAGGPLLYRKRIALHAGNTPVRPR